jgi:hypothetical protein
MYTDQQPTSILGVIPVSGRLFCWLNRYGDTIQIRHSMPQEAAKTDPSYSYIVRPCSRAGQGRTAHQAGQAKCREAPRKR